MLHMVGLCGWEGQTIVPERSRVPFDLYLFIFIKDWYISRFSFCRVAIFVGNIRAYFCLHSIGLLSDVISIPFLLFGVWPFSPKQVLLPETQAFGQARQRVLFWPQSACWSTSVINKSSWVSFILVRPASSATPTVSGCDMAQTPV